MVLIHTISLLNPSPYMLAVLSKPIPHFPSTANATRNATTHESDTAQWHTIIVSGGFCPRLASLSSVSIA